MMPSRLSFPDFSLFFMRRPSEEVTLDNRCLPPLSTSSPSPLNFQESPPLLFSAEERLIGAGGRAPDQGDFPAESMLVSRFARLPSLRLRPPKPFVCRGDSVDGNSVEAAVDASDTPPAAASSFFDSALGVRSSDLRRLRLLLCGELSRIPGEASPANFCDDPLRWRPPESSLCS